MSLDAAWVGLISGTSADGIDAALVRFDEGVEVVHAATHPYPDTLRQRLIEVSQRAIPLTLDEFAELDHQVGRCFAAAAASCIDEARARQLSVTAIGSHGQTLRHRPHGLHPFTQQIGDPSLIAERCGTTTVADFRRRDVAAGGQGAPLLPGLHNALFHCPTESRAVLNLGGIANLTLLPVHGEVRGFDSGPANALLDAWCLRHTGASLDQGGRWAQTGRAQPVLLEAWLSDPWFALPPPKSTGRDQFHLDWLGGRAPMLGDHTAQDVQASLIELTARSVADALRTQQPETRRLIACGGGVHNPVLMQALQAALPELLIESSARHGLDPDVVEAVGFAWLARQTLLGLPGNIPAVTGARGPRVLGAIYPA